MKGRETHGMSRTAFYVSWRAMLARSTPGSDAQRRSPSYVGVGRDPRWQVFENFRDDMLDTWFEGACLGRIGDTGDYTKENARWITKSESSREMAETSGQIIRTSDGRFAIDVARENGLSGSVLRQRISVMGWDVDRACTEPLSVVRRRTSDGRPASRVARENGISPQLMHHRIVKKGMSVDAACTTPVRGTPQP